MKERDYYSRQTCLKEVGSCGQKKLQEASVLIVGAGGLGHPAASYLAASGVGMISIVDFDQVEMSNLNRQIYFTPEDIGKFKSEVLAGKVKKQNPFVKVNFKNQKISPTNIEKIIKGFDLIIDCSDDFATKFLLHDFAWMNGIHFVQASLYQYEGQVQVFNYKKMKDKGCLRCLWEEVPSSHCVGSCEEAGVVGATAGTIGSIQAMEAIKLILEIGDHLENKTLLVDLLNVTTQKIKWRKNNLCPLCSSEPRIKAITQDHFEKREDFELEKLTHKETTVIDIREKNELSKEMKPFETHYKHWPLSEYSLWKDSLNREEKYLFVCEKGTRSFKLVKSLRERHFIHCYSLHKGMGGVSF